MEDQAIVELYWARDERALEATQRKYGSYLMKIAGGFLGDPLDREESVNDTYMAAWDSIPPQRPAALCAYLAKLVRRTSIDLLRRNTAQKRGGTEYALSLSELSGCLEGGTSAEASVEARALAACVEEFLRGLSRQERVLFLCRYFYMDSLKAAALYSGMGEGKAKTLLFRIRCRLRTHLQKEGFIP